MCLIFLLLRPLMEVMIEYSLIIAKGWSRWNTLLTALFQLALRSGSQCFISVMVTSRIVCHVQFILIYFVWCWTAWLQVNDGIYRPPKLQPVILNDKRSKDASRLEKALSCMATENHHLKGGPDIIPFNSVRIVSYLLRCRLSVGVLFLS
jgi:hypothetical protein